ncbi:unnamed protein product [Rotaria magnacalcarata]|uniref:MATH domain-containing protein n=1 Tax=Rotaria magnacalcarata TaxID=392030 RepID=A0A816DRT1_9BILA|nr:unnamed protein product [Rotaria magnacalcarata]CAF4080656.1 unnamed protein product [Rotaria magnacalcarata]
MASKEHISCPLCTFACKNTSSKEEWFDHLKNEVHMESIIKILKANQSVYEEATIQEKIQSGANSRSDPLKNDYLQLMLAMTDTATKHMPKSYESMNAITRLSTINPNLSSTSSSMRNSIIAADRNSTHASHIQLLQEQQQHNEASINLLVPRIVSSSGCSDENNDTQQNEQHTNASSATLSNDVEAHLTQLKLLKCELDEKPVSTDGILVWHLDKLSESIENAVSQKKSFIDSNLLKTSMNGPRFFARVYLNGKNDHKYISFHVHLNFPVTSTFSGNMELILVDQSNSRPLKHIIRSCQGQMNSTNASIGFDDFTDKQHLHQASSRYIRDDAADVIILIQQTNEEKFAQYPPNIRHALLQYQSIV